MPTEQPKLMASVAVMPLEPFALSPKETAIVENCGVSVVYERLARGEYEAVKDGTRTKIVLESIKRRRAGLPKAKFQPPRPRKSGRASKAPGHASGNPSYPKS
jgi:hypothetical protein